MTHPTPHPLLTIDTLNQTDPDDDRERATDLLSWQTPPVEFSFGESTPRLPIAAVRFFDYVLKRLDTDLADHVNKKEIDRDAS